MKGDSVARLMGVFVVADQPPTCVEGAEGPGRDGDGDGDGANGH